jgi:hypothetical protein
LEKAILFAVGNTLVCEDLEEAKILSWSGERFKGNNALILSVRVYNIHSLTILDMLREI